VGGGRGKNVRAVVDGGKGLTSRGKKYGDRGERRRGKGGSSLYEKDANTHATSTSKKQRSATGGGGNTVGHPSRARGGQGENVKQHFQT